MVTAAGPAAAVHVGRLSSDSIPVGGFTPGAILADRYRIIGLLGRGGMGEVYRADDVKLGQPVALKFLNSGDVADTASGFFLDDDVRLYLQRADSSASRWNNLDASGMVGFFYRQSPRPLVGGGPRSGPGPDDPPLQYSGEVEIRLDGDGRLRTFEAVPPRVESAASVDTHRAAMESLVLRGHSSRVARIASQRACGAGPHRSGGVPGETGEF